MALVKEFYANLYDPEDKSRRQVRVQGKLKVWWGDTEHLPGDPSGFGVRGEIHCLHQICSSYPDPQELASKLCILGHDFVWNAEGAPWKLPRKDLTTLAQTWSILSYSNLAPTYHTSDLNMDRARLVYGLVTKMNMDVSSFISGQISQMTQSNSSRLGFPALISSLCIARGVVLDLLTFESLSPIINLAYIRKNS